MTELKTLKDIPSSPNEDDYTDHSSYYRDISLRQEAIKWIKLLGTTTENEVTEENVAISDWIKHFFNITDKEIKDDTN